ncbi:MAG: tRNA (guanosine(46)-N7)-methyltransferase TrmB [Chromatiaceae bacterium]|nr:tRNA (guanosine(46)-N7)-methyltransferase TrmB [Chromatiaceae bacterium]
MTPSQEPSPSHVQARPGRVPLLIESPPDHSPQRRPIRSYVLRQGRLTEAQERAFAELWPRYGVEWGPGQALDLPALFGNDQAVYLEIGFGNGETLAEIAARHPERNYLGIEVHGPGVGHLLLEIERRGLGNLRLLRQDAVDLLDRGLAPASLAGIYLLFPDPWPKKRHHKRRILNPEFVTRLARVIRPGGLFHAATDWEPYALRMMEVLTMSDAIFMNTAGPGAFAPRPEDRPLTKFEQRGQRLGHGVWDLIFLRR